MGARESYLYVEDERIFEHSENDGAVFLRKGAEETEREVSISDLSREQLEALLWDTDYKAGSYKSELAELEQATGKRMEYGHGRWRCVDRLP